MADTLNFGPEWLRTLADGGSVTSPPPSPSFAKFKLADHRYGREEFLALFNPSAKVPEDLMQSPSIVVEKAQTPMTFLPITDEEQRLLSQSVNSTAVLRVMGRGSGGPAVRGGRGGGPDRGRGRGRGRDGFYGRGPYDEEGGGFARTRMHNRSESWEDGREPKWFDRDRDRFSGRAFDEPPSPRKDFSRSMSSENWREARKPEEEDDESDWRKAGSKGSWSRGSWREGGEGRRFFSNDYPEDRGNFQQSYGRERHNSRGRYTSGSYEDEQDDLPEWSLADAEDVGTFDASGAFMSMKDMQELEDHNGPQEDGDKKITVKNGADETSKQNVSEDSGKNQKEPDKGESSTNSNSAEDLSSRSQNNIDIKQRQDSESSKKPIVVTASESDKGDIVRVEKHGSPPSNTANSDDGGGIKMSTETNGVRKENPAPMEVEDNFDHLAKATEDMVDNWTAEEEEKSNTKAKVESGGVPLDHEDAKKWFYMDPQGDLQGPFTSSEMAEWFSAGYFTMSLSVKRGCDERFQPLGELIKRWGRIPFMPGQSPPPLLNNHNPVSPENNQDQIKQQEQQRLLQQQQQFAMQQHLMQQQLAMQRQQMQMQLIIQQLQQQEGFSKLSQVQQMALVQQLYLKQQQQLLQQMSQKPSPRSPPSSEANPIHRSMSQPSELHHPTFQRSMSQPNVEEDSVPGWGANNPPVSGAWTQGTSVWDIEPPTTTSIQELQRMEQEKIRKEREKVEAELRAQQEEEQRKLEEMQRQEEEMRFEMRRQEEMRRQQEEMTRRETERQRQLEQAQEEVRRREEEERKRREAEEEMKRKQELLRQQRELQERQQLREAELERQAQEELRRRQRETTSLEFPPMDAQRQQEIQRQQEALRRIQQAQLTQMQLPATAQWANSSSTSTTGTATLSLSQIQQLQEEKERKEREEKQRLNDLQRQQMQAIHAQQQSQQKSWGSHMPGQASAPKSLLEIQEEQSRQLEKEKQRQVQQQQARQNLSLGAAAAWGAQQAGWATEGAWAQNKGSMGFWDEAVASSNNKMTSQRQNNAAFPSLSAAVSVNGPAQNTNRVKNTKAKKEEEAVQRLFQAMKPADEFTQWCERALRGMHTSVDVPTFIAFLQEVESPYEVQDYVRSYLGETQQARDFAKEFIEKRSAFKHQGKHGQSEIESMIGPAKANPGEWTETQKVSKKKKKMQKIDGSAVLGFSVQADSNRKNVGEIEALETM